MQGADASTVVQALTEEELSRLDRLRNQLNALQILGTFVSLAVLAFVYLTKSMPSGLWVPFLLSYVPYHVVRLRSWRCPRCRKVLPGHLRARFCSSCQVEFRAESA